MTTFPEGMTLVPITGRVPGALSIKFVCRYPLVGATADTIMRPFAEPAVLALDGTFTVSLPANDDPEWEPVTWQYGVFIDYGTGRLVQGALTVPIADAETGFDLADRIVLTTPVPPIIPGAGGGDGGPVAWSDITGKPATFAPSAHSQAISTITGLQAALDAASAAPATHAIGAITGLQAALDAKALQEDVTDLGEAVAALEAVGPVVFSWSGSAYVADSDARVYVGPTDPGAVADGSVWIDTSA